MTRTQLLTSLRSLVVYHRSCGIDYYPDSELLQSGLKALAEFTDKEPIPKSIYAKQIQKPVSKTPEPAATSGISLTELTREITGCRICSLHESRKISTPGRGGSTPHLLIAGDWLVHHAQIQENELLGAEQDLMLGNMIKAIGLGADDVFVTNVIKCSVEPSYRAQSEHLSACVSYLKQQIALLRPKVICTMGTVVSQALLNTDKSLIGLRGTFHQYVLADGTGIPLMPTFNPTYLLKNPEMKKPTWGDLQAIRKQLDKNR